ncbi:MAG: hypothetical protein PVJ39_17035 [Gammaproteobacteria bacterium]|jgi:hypothetical protein
MGNLFVFIRLTPILVVLLLFVGCDSSPSAQAQSDFDKLCKIYEETLQNPTSHIMQAVEITERAEKEVPNIAVHVENIANVNAKDADPLFKKIAEKQTKKSWDCKAMKEFYSFRLEEKSK